MLLIIVNNIILKDFLSTHSREVEDMLFQELSWEEKNELALEDGIEKGLEYAIRAIFCKII
jgi:hypothetical protein